MVRWFSKDLLLTWVLCFFVLYFSWHLLMGRHGLLKATGVSADIAAVRQQLDDNRAQIALIEDKTRRLRGASVDIDYLDQRARELAGLAHPDELVVDWASPPS